MSESPSAKTPYEVLGVESSVSDEELRRAYRRLLRQTHPDVGGTAARFQAVQTAWERIGTPEDRARYDRQRYSSPDESFTPSSRASSASGTSAQRTPSSGLRARMHGHPGGQSRQRYLDLLREWAGRGTVIDDPYDPTLIRRAPQEIRHILAKAMAEETTASLVSGLGIGYTAWHDVDAGANGIKVDHVVLGPSGLFAILSEDWGGPVRLRKGELEGESLAPGEEPIAEFESAARSLARALGVRFTALVIVTPDAALTEPIMIAHRGRRPSVIALPRPRLVGLLRDGLPGMDKGSFEKVFDLRGTLQNGIRFVEF
jgi:hypothetical protein